MQIETVKVVSPVSDENPLGYIVINKEDMTEDRKIFVEKADKPATGKKADKPADEAA